MLDVSALNSLPLDRSKFEEGMFLPLYEQVKATLSAEPLLPAHRDGYLSAGQALLARGQDLRELLDERQLSALFPAAFDRGWLAGAITQDRTPELRQYLMRELGVQEIAPDTLLGKLNAEFLERQPDAWIERLYAFLGGQPGLRATAARLPLVRLTDGTHVRPHIQGAPQAFLVGNFKSDFPTVRPEVCRDPQALAFLVSLGLTVPDRVDDVLRNVLPKYGANRKSMTLPGYAADVTRIVAAFRETDSRHQREKLVSELRGTAFVLAVSAADGRRVLSPPGATVLPTDRLKELLSGIQGALIVDDQQACLQGQDVRDLLETCGTARHLRLLTAPDIGWAARAALREEAGHAETSGQNDSVSDLTLFGLKEIIAKLAQLDPGARRRHAELLWEALALIADRRGKSVFTAQYAWTHYGKYQRSFPATFVRILSRMNRNQKGSTTPSAVRANLDDPPIHIRPIVPASAGAKDKNPVGSGHYGTLNIAPRLLNRNGFLCRKCQESGAKGLNPRAYPPLRPVRSRYDRPARSPRSAAASVRDRLVTTFYTYPEPTPSFSAGPVSAGFWP